MHFNNCALFLLMLVTCQAAPSSKLIKEQLISEPQSIFVTNGLESKDTGTEKGRVKKSTTTFCVEVRSGKPEQVLCRNKQQSHVYDSEQSERFEPVVIMEPIISIPALAPIVKYPKPLIIQSPVNYILPIEQTSPLQPSQPTPISVSASISAPAPTSTATSTPTVIRTPISSPIINVISQALPCDESSVVQSQLPQFHKIETHHQLPPLKLQSSKTMPYIHLSSSKTFFRQTEQETPQSSSKLPPYEFPYHKAITVPNKLLPLLTTIKENTTISDDIVHTIVEHLPKPSLLETLQHQNNKTWMMSESSARQLKDLILALDPNVNNPSRLLKPLATIHSGTTFESLPEKTSIISK